MNILLTLGFIIAFGSVFGGFILEKGAIASLWQLSSFCIVFGGTIGIALISFPLNNLKTIPGALKLILVRKKKDGRKLVDMLCDIDNKARREGLLSLETEAEKVTDPFLKKGLEYVADGVDPEYLKKMLENEIEVKQQRYEDAAAVFDGMGGTAPTMGVLGTVMGMTNVLANMDNDVKKLCGNIAVAFIATFYGVGSANLIWIPIGQHIKVVAEKESDYMEVVVEGLMAIQAGEPSSRLRARLNVMLDEKNNGAGKSNTEKAEDNT